MSFWRWSLAAYARPGAEQLLLRMQDAHALNVTMLLWCVWCGATFDELAPTLLRKGRDIADHWEAGVVAPIRLARRALKSPPPEADREKAAALRQALKDDELRAEEVVQQMLQSLAEAHASPASGALSAAARARRNLAAYVRLTPAAASPGFTVSLLEELIALTLSGADSDGAARQDRAD